MSAGSASKRSVTRPSSNCRYRAAFVREACAGDDALRAEVESLLANESRADALGTGLRIGERVGIGCRSASRSASIRSTPCSARAGWARSIARATPSWTRRRHQDPAAAVHGRPRSRGALRARSAGARLAQPSAHRRRSTDSKTRTACRPWCSSWSRATTLADRVAPGPAAR